MLQGLKIVKSEVMNICIDKDEYIDELEKVLKYFYEAKTIEDKEQIKYFQGMAKGIILILKKQKLLQDDELKVLVKSVELDIPTIYRGEK